MELRNFVLIPCDHEIARCYGKLVAVRYRMEYPISLNESWIAACEVRYGIPLVTHNAGGFAGISVLEIISETI